MKNTLTYYEQEFSKLKINKIGQHKRPHKLAMLLTVLELIKKDKVTNNRIKYDELLVNTYAEYFDKYAKSSDRKNPNYPFYYLKDSSFWHHKIKPNRESYYLTFPKGQPMSQKQLAENIEYSFLDRELFEFLKSKNGAIYAILESALFKNYDGEYFIQNRTPLIETIETENILTFDDDQKLIIDYFKMLQNNTAPAQNIFEPAPVLNNKPTTTPKIKVIKNKNWVKDNIKKQKIGYLGEAFVLERERLRLMGLGKKDLAKEVEWTSKVKGDGLGYDIRSFNGKTDAELFIEVKATTNKNKTTPFLITRNEVFFSEKNADKYSLYRVFNLNQDPKIFRLNGDLEQHVTLQEHTYKAYF